MGRSILLITQFYPPSDMVAARRPAGLAKELERLGHRVTVLTSGAWGDRDAADEEATRVVRTGDLMASRLNWRRDQLRAWTGESGPADDYAAGSSRLARVIVPDVALATWLPYLLPAALRAARRDRFDVVITTSGPESVHLAGLALRRRGPAWVADLRDGWGFETLHDWPTSLQRALDDRLERRVMSTADGVSAVTEPIAQDLRTRLGADAWTITNGFDPDETAAADDHGLFDPARHTLLHSGRMASSQRSPGPVLAAMALLARRDPSAAAALELALAGPVTAQERELAGDPELGGSVRLLGNLPRATVLGLQRAAGSLLLLTAGNRRGEATGKLYEYLAAGRPILVLGERTEAARIVLDAGAGLAVPSDDPEAIAGALARLAAGEVPAGEDSARERYAYPRLAARMAELIELACARRAGAQRNTTA
jgi:glycosyltransferase involved in cell wall biosynthesis